MKLRIDPALASYIKAILSRKALGLTVLDVRMLTSLADVFMICSGRSNRQVTAIAEHIQRDLKNQGIKPLSVEGMREGHWVLLDYGHVIIHVFTSRLLRFLRSGRLRPTPEESMWKPRFREFQKSLFSRRLRE